MKAYGKGEGHAWLGRLLVVWPLRLGPDHPLVDGCMTALAERDDDTGEEAARVRYGGLCFRVPFRDFGAGFGWRGARIMNPYRWRPSAVWRRIRWNLAGRPAPTPMAWNGAATKPSPGPRPASPASPASPNANACPGSSSSAPTPATTS